MSEQLPSNTVANFESAALWASVEHPMHQALDRFTLQNEQFIVSSYQAAQELFSQVQSEVPAVVGAAAFGSTVKGSANPETSDLDLSIFVDTTQLGLEFDASNTDGVLLMLPWSVYGNKGKQVARKLLPAAKEISEPFKNAPDCLPINEELVPISHELIIEAAHRITQKAERRERYLTLRMSDERTKVDDVADWLTLPTDAKSIEATDGLAGSLAHTSEDRPLDVMDVIQGLGNIATTEGTELSELRPKMLQYDRLGSAVPYRLFGMAITDRLAPYRETFLRTLSESKALNSRINIFLDQLMKFETSVSRPRPTDVRTYPATLSSAYEAYVNSPVD